MAKNHVLDVSNSSGKVFVSVVGMPEPIAHPVNCKHECPYGHDRAFCFPCYAKIMAEHRAKQNKTTLEVRLSSGSSEGLAFLFADIAKESELKI